MPNIDPSKRIPKPPTPRGVDLPGINQLPVRPIVVTSDRSNREGPSNPYPITSPYITPAANTNTSGKIAAIVNRGIQQVTAGNSGGSGGISGGLGTPEGLQNAAPVTPAGPTFDDSLINKGYDNLMQVLAARARDASSLYDQAKTSVAGNYQNALADLRNSAAIGQGSLERAASGLGVQLDDVSRVANLSRLTATGEQAGANRGSTLDVLKALRGDLFNSLSTGAEQDRLKTKLEAKTKFDEMQAELAAIAAGASAGGSSGRSGGGRGYRRSGSGSSGSGPVTISETATEDSVLKNVGDVMLIEELRKSDPKAAAELERAYNLAGDGTLSVLQKRYDQAAAAQAAANKPKVTGKGLFGNVIANLPRVVTKAANSGAPSLASIQAALNQAKRTSGQYGNPATTLKTQDKSTQKRKVS